MKLSVIHTGYLKLDGGAMFGVVPRQLWQRLNPPDERNMCTWAMRSLLIEEGDRKILVDTGIGDKQDDKFRSHFEPSGPENLLDSLTDKGVGVADVTDVFLTHLHFDHCGGAISRNEAGELVPTFPNATYWSNEAHFNSALNPNPREKASFLKENILPLQEAGVLKFIEDGASLTESIKVKYVYGHTEAMMLLYIQVRDLTLIYCADLLPSSYHIGMPYVMSYDIRPLMTMQEKQVLLDEAVAEKYVLFFEHDPKCECATVKRNDRGRIVLDETFLLDSLFG